MYTLSFAFFSSERIYCVVPIKSVAKHIQVFGASQKC